VAVWSLEGADILQYQQTVQDPEARAFLGIGVAIVAVLFMPACGSGATDSGGSGSSKDTPTTPHFARPLADFSKI
jgi:hypothetical protein